MKNGDCSFISKAMSFPKKFASIWEVVGVIMARYPSYRRKDQKAKRSITMLINLWLLSMPEEFCESPNSLAMLNQLKAYVNCNMPSSNLAGRIQLLLSWLDEDECPDPNDEEACDIMYRISKASFDELQGENMHLKSANQNLTLQVPTMQEEMNQLQLKLKTTEDSIVLIEAEKASLQEAFSTELRSLQKEMEDALADNVSLAAILNCMNIGMCQYETRVKQISKEEAEMRSLRRQIQDMGKENKDLEQKLNESLAAKEEWKNIETRMQLAMDENKLLKERLRIQETKAHSTDQEHLLEVTKVTKQLALEETKTKELENLLRESTEQLKNFRIMYQELLKESDRKISVDAHASLKNKLKMKQQKKMNILREVVENIWCDEPTTQLYLKNLLTEAEKVIMERDAHKHMVGSSNLQRKAT